MVLVLGSALGFACAEASTVVRVSVGGGVRVRVRVSLRSGVDSG